MEDKIFITHDEQNNVTGAFGFEPEVPFITVPSSIWQQFAIYKKEDIVIEAGQLTVSTDALLVTQKAKKVRELETAFQVASKLPVTVGKNTYNGGEDSAGKLKGALSLASDMSQSIVTFFDINNLPIELSLTDALTVITTIGAKYQSDFAKFQAYKVSINTSTSVEEIQSIVWSN